MFFRLFSVAPMRPMDFSDVLRDAGTLMNDFARKVLAGERYAVLLDLLRRALGHDLAAVDTGAGPHVDHMVGGADGLFVVFHHEHCVPEVAEPKQGIKEPPVVPLVQPDARFIKDVENAHQGRADLRGKPDTLSFTAGERGRAAVKSEVIEAHVHHESESLADLLQDPLGNGGLFLREREACKERQRLLDAHACDVVDVHAGHLDGKRLLAQPAAAAVRAGLVAHVLFELPLGDEGIGLVVAPFQYFDDAFEGFARCRAFGGPRDRRF